MVAPDILVDPPRVGYDRDRREYTVRDIAQELGVSHQAVVQIGARALKKLRAIIQQRGWEAGFRALLQ